MNPALDILIRVLMAVFWLVVVMVSCALVFVFWLLTGAEPQGRAVDPGRRRRLAPYEETERVAQSIADATGDSDPGDVNDYDTTRDSAPSRPRRGVARAEGIGPAILGRKQSRHKVGLADLDASSRNAIEEVIRTAGNSR